WTRVCEVVKATQIEGPHVTPKALRNGFGVDATVNSVSLNKVQKWLGHADLKRLPYMPKPPAQRKTAFQNGCGERGLPALTAAQIPATGSRNATISCPFRTSSISPAIAGWFHVLSDIAGNRATSVN